MTVPPPRNFLHWFRRAVRFPLSRYLWPVRVPFPLGAVGTHAALTQGVS